MASAHHLPFHAPIPRGHDVLLVTFGLENKAPTVVLDRTTSTLYCGEDMWGPLQNDPALAVTDPIALVTRWTWKVRSTIEGVCAGALISTRHVGESHDVKTILLVDAAGTPYR